MPLGVTYCTRVDPEGIIVTIAVNSEPKERLSEMDKLIDI